MKKTLTIIGLALASAVGAQAQVLITQYYEGTSNNKWIELKNIGSSSVNLGTSNYRLSLWTNANAEAYKTNGTPSQTLNLTGTINAGQVLLFQHASATTPSYALTYSPTPVANSTVINFNGNDSVTLWSGTTFSTASIIDAIGFTNTGNEGADTSFIRLTSSPGWNTTAGSEVTDFSSVWQQITLATVDSAAVSTNARLGFSTVPEPSTWALIGLGTTVVLMGIRRRRSIKA